MFSKFAHVHPICTVDKMNPRTITFWNWPLAFSYECLNYIYTHWVTIQLLPQPTIKLLPLIIVTKILLWSSLANNVKFASQFSVTEYHALTKQANNFRRCYFNPKPLEAFYFFFTRFFMSVIGTQRQVFLPFGKQAFVLAKGCFLYFTIWKGYVFLPFFRSKNWTDNDLPRLQT